ncbi:MAG: glycerol-3-phosphate cytidylyltransferase [Deltaproteobacteria bacterium RBG_19FT_COMBO_46_12]|nr:MAG: glycerol-3-phosphate cytidylyltransferase [Deltaproteobacteria bacterium RBG_19FT_COMBO_46_12]
MIVSLLELVPIVAGLKQAGRRIVFTNGCFDILHVGHVRYLKSARALGGTLIVGLNSDKSVKRIKGDKRPIVPERERAEVLSSIRFVDYVVMFDEPDPYNTIAAIKPDILVKGGDWSLENIVGRDIVESYGGEVHTLPFIEGASSSRMIEDIVTRYGKL